ncbi:MAG: c-type cytochrome [Chloroflexota bacterium]
MDRRWIVILAMTSMVAIIIAGCGRVDLEDLTPEAVRTEQAEARITQTAVSEAGEELEGDPQRGATTFGTWCVGCHAEGGGGQGPDLIGETYFWEDVEPAFRTEGEPLPSGNPHPSTYQTFDLTDDAFRNIFAYVATAD